MVILALHLIAKLVEFLFSIFRKKSEVVDQSISQIDLALTANTRAMNELRIQMQLLEREMAVVHKLSGNVQELFTGIRYLSGPDWSEVRKAMKEDVSPG